MEEPIVTFDVSPVTALMVETLVKTPYGGQITYAQLQDAAGVDHMTNLASARRIAARDHGAVFTSIRGVGLMRLKAEDAALVGQNSRHKIRRAATKSVKEMTSMIRGNNDLTDENRRKISAEIAHNGLLAHLSTHSAHDKIAANPILADGARADARLFNNLMKEN